MGATTSAQQEGGVYNWRLKPGMPEWKELTTHNEMLEVLQIPTETLKKMRTHDLAQTCLHYPLFSDIWAFNSLQDGMERVMAGFNGFEELFKRNESSLELMAIYKSMDPHEFDEKWSDLEKGRYTAQFAKIEALLAQENILASLNQNERLLLLEESINKQKAMQQYSIYDNRNKEPNAYLMSKIMLKDNSIIIKKISQNEPDFIAFLNRGSMATEGTINEILVIANNYLNNYK